MEGERLFSFFPQYHVFWRCSPLFSFAIFGEDLSFIFVSIPLTHGFTVSFSALGFFPLFWIVLSGKTVFLPLLLSRWRRFAEKASSYLPYCYIVVRTRWFLLVILHFLFPQVFRLPSNSSLPRLFLDFTFLSLSARSDRRFHFSVACWFFLFPP